MANECPKCHTSNPDTVKFCGECGTPLESEAVHTKTLETPQEELTTGSTFAGRYQIIEELGKGGMGRVYKVLDKETNEKIALKLIKSDIAADKKTVERFRNELTTARKIVQKNVCRMFDLGREKDSYYITMEYISGQDLRDLIRQTGQLTVGKAVSIVKQICDGLTEAHSLGVVHRDLKPNNIMIDKGGNAKIMDFGIARAVKGKSITGSGVVIGTPQYMSPEQVEGKEVDKRSDLYSLGIILYEMLTTRVPFEGETPLTIGVKQKTEAPKNPREFNDRIPEGLSGLILKCLEKDRENRYQSAQEVKSALEKLEQGLPTTHRVVPKKKPLTSREITVQLNLKKILIPALVVLFAIVVGLFLWRPWARVKPIPISSDKPSLAILYFDNLSGDESLDYWREGIAELFTIDLMQSMFINVLTRDRVLGILEKLNLEKVRSFRTEDLVKIANEGRVNHTVSGSFIKTGENILISVVLQKPHTGEVIDSHRVTCSDDTDIQPKVDGMVRRIKSKLNLSRQQMASDIDRSVGEITTSSPEAYKLYLEGRTLRNQGNFRESIALMEKAISIDPRFAMAYRSMSSSYWSLYNPARSNEYLKKAFELSDRLSERELYFIQGEYYRRSERTYDKAIDAFNKLLELYPEHTAGLTSFGILYADLEDYDKATELFEEAIRLEAEVLSPYSWVSNMYRKKGLYEKAKEVLEYYIQNINDFAVARWYLALNSFDQGEFNLALAEADKALSLDPAFPRALWTKGDIYVYQGDLNRAEIEYNKLLDHKELSTQIMGIGYLADLHSLRGQFKESKKLRGTYIEMAEKMGDMGGVRAGRLALTYVHIITRDYEKALEECEKVWTSAVEEDDVSFQRAALYWKGLAYIGQKSLDEAVQTADDLKKIIDAGPIKNLIRMYYYLMGEVELEREIYDQAIDYFERIRPLITKTSSWRIILAGSLGTAHFKAGHLEQAREEFEKVISPIPGRVGYGDIYAKAFYNLGQIFEQQGNTAQAIENYEKFLDLWKNADPGLPEVDDAKTRLARLKR